MKKSNETETPNYALKQLRKRIDLASLPKDKARVEIAKDALAAIDMKKMTACSGSYFTIDVPGEYVEAPRYNAPLRERIGKADACYVCALGAVFTAQVARENEYAGEVLTHRMVGQLERYFTKDQMKLMEGAFEGCASGAAGMLSIRKADLADKFFDLARDPTDPYAPGSQTARLRRILSNVIRNNGTFVVTDHREALPNTVTNKRTTR